MNQQGNLCTAIVFFLGAAGLGLVGLVTFFALTALLFHQGPEWVREGGFCARAAAAIGLSIGWECAWGLLLPSARRSPGCGSSGSSAFAHSLDQLLCGVIAAIAWEIVLNLIGQGLVASTFGIVAVFICARLLLFGATVLLGLVLKTAFTVFLASLW